jgi:hypothetical protein
VTWDGSKRGSFGKQEEEEDEIGELKFFLKKNRKS